MLESITLIEECAANALPAAHVQVLDGWRLRYNVGVTRRANSTLANRNTGKLPLGEKLEQVEAFYAQFGVNTRYQVCPSSQPEGLDEALDRRGYRRDGSVHVQVAELPSVLQGHAPSELHVTLQESLTDTWFDLYRHVEGADERKTGIRRVMLTRIAAPTAYALVTIDGEPAAVGLGVLEQGHVGVFNMATRPEFRRRGAAGALLYTLGCWAEQQHAHRMYLQVAEENSAAQSVYERYGFRTLYAYHYREA